MTTTTIARAADRILTLLWPARAVRRSAPALARTRHLGRQHRDRTWIGRGGVVWTADPNSDYWIGAKPGRPVIHLGPRFDSSVYGPFTQACTLDSAVPPAAADPAGSPPLPAGSSVPPEGVESRGTATPPSGVPSCYALPTSELLRQTADALALATHTLRMLTGMDLDDTAPHVVTVTQWCAGLRDRAAQFAAHGD